MSKHIFKSILMILFLSIFGTSFADLVENKDYVVLEGREQKHSIYKDKIEVIEFFSYGCPYCYIIESEVSAWQEDKPTNVIFTRVAIPRKGKWVEYARLFYALEMISYDEQERLTPLIYSAIHEQKLNFEDANEMFGWAASENIDREQLEKFYNSKEVTEKLVQALELARSYDLKYVPSIYVNNQYQLILDSSNQYQGTKDKLNELIKLAEQK